MARYLHLHYSQAGAFFTEAANENIAEAYTMLALMNLKGELGQVDLDKAWKLAAEGLNRGDKKAYYMQGILWQERTKQPNSLTGNSYFLNAMPALKHSAGEGDIFWTTRLAYCYSNGFGTAKDRAKAADLYQTAVDAGYTVAMHNLGVLYLNDDQIPVDYEKALALFRRAISLGFTTFGANIGAEVGIYDVAYAYHKGNDFVAEDRTKAMSLYAESAAKGYGPAFTGIGRLFNHDFLTAREYLLKGIEAGDGEAATELALHYLDTDTAKCRHYYELALSMNDNSGIPEAGLSHVYKHNKTKSQQFASQALTKGSPVEYVHLSAIEIGESAPDFEMKNERGESIKLSSLRGQYVLVDFWASWCGPCREENPKIVQVYDQYKEKGFTVLGVSLDADENQWLNAIRRDSLQWHHVSDLRGWNSAAGRLYRVDAIPQNFLLDRAGKVVAIDLHGQQLREFLDRIKF